MWKFFWVVLLPAVSKILPDDGFCDEQKEQELGILGVQSMRKYVCLAILKYSPIIEKICLASNIEI